jgi:hypothetical protein
MDEDVDLAIELGEVAKYRCPCCERESETVHGFLYDRSGATFVYFAGYTHGHPERRANMVLSVGAWGEGTTPADRKAIALQVYSVKRGLVFTFPPAETSPWYRKEFKDVAPEELSDEDRVRYRDLAKAAVQKDPRVAGYLEQG